MKHLLLFLSCCLLATSCSKDETPTSDELVGTVWSQVNEDRTDTIYFAADHKCTAEWKYEGFDAVKQDMRSTGRRYRSTQERAPQPATSKMTCSTSSCSIETYLCIGFDKTKPRTFWMRGFLSQGESVHGCHRERKRVSDAFVVFVRCRDELAAIDRTIRLADDLHALNK